MAQQMGDAMSSDVSDVANKAVEAVRDAKTVGKIAANAAAGNLVGAAVEAIKNPEFIKKVIIASLVLSLIPLLLICGFVIFLIQFPASVFTGAVEAAKDGLSTIGSSWLVAGANIESSVDEFWSKMLAGDSSAIYVDEGETDADGNNSNQVAAYLDTPELDTFWSETNLQISVINKYFKSSYKNAVKRANNADVSGINEKMTMTLDDGSTVVGTEALTQYALNNGIESEDYVTFEEPIQANENDSANFQRIAFYIMALDSYKYEISEEAQDGGITLDDGTSSMNVGQLSRMIHVAKKLSPNGFIDALETAFNIKDEHLWVTKYTTTKRTEEKEVITGYEYKTHEVTDWDADPTGNITKTVTDRDDNGNPIEDHDRPIKENKTFMIFSTTITVQLSSETRDKLYELYDIDKTENCGDHSDAFWTQKKTDKQALDYTQDMLPADYIESQVDSLAEIYGVPEVSDTSAGGAATYGGGSYRNANPLTAEQIAALIAAMGDEAANLSDSQLSILEIVQQIATSGNPNATAKALGITHFGGMCQGFISDVLQLSGTFSWNSRPNSAKDAWNNYVTNRHSTTEAPEIGALLYFDSSSAPEYGHVAMYIGGGMTIETWDGQGVRVSTLQRTLSQTWSTYLGWSSP